MPIFEFRCVKCGKVFEELFRDGVEKEAIKCPACGCEELDRVISRINYAMGGSKGGKQTTLTKRQCGENSCSTLEIPGIGD